MEVLHPIDKSIPACYRPGQFIPLLVTDYPTSQHPALPPAGEGVYGFIWQGVL